jgi:hypothetical protein
MVLENVVSAILGKYLGEYILGLKPENLSLGIFSGACLARAAALYSTNPHWTCLQASLVLRIWR